MPIESFAESKPRELSGACLSFVSRTVSRCFHVNSTEEWRRYPSCGDGYDRGFRLRRSKELICRNPAAPCSDRSRSVGNVTQEKELPRLLRLRCASSLVLMCAGRLCGVRPGKMLLLCHASIQVLHSGIYDTSGREKNSLRINGPSAHSSPYIRNLRNK